MSFKVGFDRWYGTYSQLVICSRCLVRQIEKHASQILFLLGGEKEAMNWMNGDFWLAYNGEAWKQGSLGIVNVMICMWLWQFWSLFWDERGANADYLGADQQRLQSFSAARHGPRHSGLFGVWKWKARGRRIEDRVAIVKPGADQGMAN